METSGPKHIHEHEVMTRGHVSELKENVSLKTFHLLSDNHIRYPIFDKVK